MTNPGTQNGAVGDSVALQIQSGGLPSGDSWTYAATGLPSGLSINTSSGQIGGTITGSANTYSVSVTASDGQGASASQSFTWNVSTLSVTNPGTHNGAVGDSVALQIQAGGLPSGDSWTYAATGLPSGLSINTSSGQIGGTITGSANAYSVSVTASDGQGASASQSFTWNVSTLSVTNPGTHERRGWRQRRAADSVQRSAQRRYVDLRCHRLAVGPLHQHQLGPDRRHDHWLGECLLGLGHGQRRPGRERQPELHLERVHPVGD